MAIERDPTMSFEIGPFDLATSADNIRQTEDALLEEDPNLDPTQEAKGGMFGTDWKA